MKIKKILLSLAVIFTAFFNTQNANAGSNDSNITYQRIDNAYFYIQDNNTGAVDTNHVTKFFMNGKIAFCIEPMADINTRVYNSAEGLDVSGLSNDTKRLIQLYGHYGYDYPGHQTDKYWLATQKLLWETTKNVSVKFTTGANGTGSVIDLSAETNEIKRLVNNNGVKPSFNTTTAEGNIGQTITVTDNNSVLGEYNMVYSGKHKVVQNGNKITITFADKVMNTESVEFYRKAYDNQTTILYYQGNSQKLASLRVADPTYAVLNIKSNGATVEIDKKGEEIVYENAGYRYEEINLKDVTFAVYANENITDANGNIVYKKYDLVGTLKSGENGIATLKDLYYGKYFLLEGETDPNHIADNQKYDFEITKSDIINGKVVKHFDFKNIVKKGTLKFTKYDLTDGHGIPGTVIQIFLEKNDRIIFTGTTSETGEIIIEDLPLNEPMYMIEKSASKGYKLSDEKVSFMIKENGEVVKAKMSNEKITGSVEISKLDISTSKPLPNTLIEVYKADTDEKIFSGRTNEEGKIVIDNLEYGKYYFLEKEAPEGYELNPEKMYFEITEDGQVVKCTLQDKKIEEKEPTIVVKVPNTLINDYTTIGLIVLIVLGIGSVIVYEIKIKKNQK